MSPGDKSCLAAEVFHFNVKDHVAGYFLIADRCRLPVRKDFESNTNVFLLFVKLKSFFFDGLRHLDAKFMGPFKVSRALLLHERDDRVSLFENMGHPPVEGMVQAWVGHFVTPLKRG